MTGITLHRRTLAVDTALAALPKRPVMPIGDVHGRHDLLMELLGGKPDGAAEIYLGDYVDRGPHGVKVMETIRDRARDGHVAAALQGNHEAMMIAALSSRDPQGMAGAMFIWLRNGGGEVVAELFPDDFEDAHEATSTVFGCEDGHDVWRKRIIRALGERGVLPVAWGNLHGGRSSPNPPIMHTEPTIDGRRIVFVHAGVHPGMKIDEFISLSDPSCLPDDEDFHPQWIRKSFLLGADTIPAADAALVVHGHTISKVPQWSSGGRRLGLDTGGYSRGRLTACVMAPDGMTLLQACGPGIEPTIDQMAVPECLRVAAPEVSPVSISL